MAIDPWEIKKDDSRQADTLANYIIFCEDENTEPVYFESFATTKVRISVARNQKQGNRNFLNTVSNCIQEGKMEFTADGYRIKEDITENIWSVYDRDANFSNPAQDRLDDIDFTTAIHNAGKAGIKVAWSNDAFELWILLHFEPVAIEKRLHRDDIYNRLREIIRALPGLREDLINAMMNPRFSYESYFKRRNNFVLNLLPVLKSRTAIAMKNAADLSATYVENIAFHDRNPCTMVHVLVQELLAANER